MTQNLVKFRYGSGVTANSPDLLPGAFTFDSNTFALYLDNNQERLQIQDPLKLSITGGNMSGDIRVMHNGLVSCSLNAQSGEIRGVFFTTTGEISIETPPGKYAVIDDNGRIRYITRQQVLADLGIDNLGALAYKDTVTGSFVPMGTVSAPTVTVNYTTESVIKDITAGELPSLSVNNQVLSLTPGSQGTSNSTNVMKEITSVDVSTPIFTGIEATITLH